MKIKKSNSFLDISLFFFFVIVLSAVVDVGIITLAEEEETEEIVVSDEFDCDAAVMAYLSEADPALEEFWTQVLTSEEQNSSLVDLVLEAQNAYEVAAQEALDGTFATAGGKSLVDVTDKIAECQGVIDEHVEANERVLVTQVASSSAGKKTTALLEEYKWLNEKLRDMTTDVGYVNAYLKKMSDMFPGFLKQCIKM